VFGHRRNGHALRASGELRIVVEAGRTPLNLVQVLDPRLAAFPCQQFRETRPIRAHQGGGFVEQFPALERRHLSPLPLCLRRRRARAPDIVRGRIEDLVDELGRRRILDLPYAAAVRILPAAIDPQSLHGVWFMTDVGSFDQPAENVTKSATSRQSTVRKFDAQGPSATERFNRSRTRQAQLSASAGERLQMLTP